MNSNIRIGELFGIPFYINPSWFLVFGLVTLTYSNELASLFPQLPGGIPYFLGLITALLLFGSVLAHELGHSFVAMSQGINVKSITLFIFGGLANLEKESKTPAGAFWVAISGPLVSLFIFGLLTIAGYSTHATGPIASILALLASINLALACFNLIPGLPLDGGNILKAIVWKLTGNPYRGVKVASRVGQAVGWFAIATGLLPLFVSGSFGSVWNLIIGWFLVQNAGQAAQFATLQEKMVNLTAADAVVTDSPVVLDHLTLREFADQFIVKSGHWRKFLVTNQPGQLVGTISIDALRTMPTDEWTVTVVRDLMQPIEPSMTIAAKLPLIEVLQQLEEKHLMTLSVVADNGILVGILEKTAILELLQGQPQVVSA